MNARDLARWAFWVHGPALLDPARPGRARALGGLWWAQLALGAERRALLEDEFRRCFSDGYTDRGYRALVADSLRVAWLDALGELILGRVSAETIGAWLRLEGREHLDAALSAGRGALVVYPHAGPIMLMIGALGWAGYDYTQYAARGLAPAEVAAAHPAVMGHNRWREQARAAREAAEDRLPARFLTLETSARALHRRLAAGGLVGIAFDGRIGSRFIPVQWLGRTCLLNPGPARLALTTGAPLVPAFCETGREGPGICRLHAPMWPEGRDAAALLAAFVLQHAEPWVRTHPEEYGPWLLHCRMRAAVDDHPFFLDYAPDDRYRRHLPPGFIPTASHR